MERITFGFIANPDPSREVNLGAVRAGIEMFMGAMQTACMQDGVNEVTIVTGPAEHAISCIVREVAARYPDWRLKFGPQWDTRPSTFLKDCDVLVRIGDDPDPWCDYQERLFRARGGLVHICYFV